MIANPAELPNSGWEGARYRASNRVTTEIQAKTCSVRIRLPKSDLEFRRGATRLPMYPR
jgi:hypothetical protein